MGLARRSGKGGQSGEQDAYRQTDQHIQQDRGQYRRKA
jgi:hypothetical protein